ncbi:MAG: hypothetical protein A2340_13490 [Lentisphaerae bacterium RIFOXYB12_FULL_60_10]|nr:MAG: hypothetical protein A2269_08400 [Lentisphaerae bacterium RIFOXYA12_FULL_60_10]OGV84168.1 MAG: hypothetical protein A2340_13490 [Lentisphaerae bacterium RIFOXYB12_FULL_60_10]
MMLSARYREQWERYQDLFGWSRGEMYWGLPTWTPELVSVMDRVLAGQSAGSPWRDAGVIRMAASGWLATGDPRYAGFARTHYTTRILDAEAANFTKPSLAQAVLLQEWLSTLGGFMDSEAFPAPFVDRLLAGVVRLADRLAGRICPASMNWRVADAANLLKTALLLDTVPESASWRGLSVRALNDAVNRQINADGSHRERNPHYHVWMTQELTLLWRMANALPELGLRVRTERVAAMWDYALFCNRPNGTENGLHDSRGWFEGGRPDREQPARAAFLESAGLPAGLPAPNGWFPDAGQALLRDAWEPDAVYLTFDATRWGEGHCHYSRNSLQIHAYGRTLLADPGVFEYADTPLGNYGRSTRAHSTLNLNGWNQAQTNPVQTAYRHAPGYDLVWSDYEGTFHPGRLSMVHGGDLGRGIWVSHHRFLMWIHGQAIVVVDSFVRVPDHDEQHETAPFLESNWQLGPGPVTWDPSVRRLVTGHPDANLLMVFPVLPDGCRGTVHTGEADPPRGFVSDLYTEFGEDVPNRGRPLAAPQLCLALAPMSSGRAEFVSVLVPFRGRTPPAVQATARAATLKEPGSLQLDWADGRRDSLVWGYRLDIGLGERPGYDTDASLVHVTHDAAGGVRGLALDATYIRPYRDAVAAVPGLIRF